MINLSRKSSGCLPTGNRKYQIKEMHAVHKEIVRRVHIGEKNVEIAEALGVTPEMVSYTRNSAIAKRQLDIMEGTADLAAVDVRKRIDAMAGPATELLNEVMSKGEIDGKQASLHLRVKIAMDALDRSGHSAVKKVLSANHTFGDDDLKEIRERAKKFRPLGIVKEAEYESVATKSD